MTFIVCTKSTANLVQALRCNNPLSNISKVFLSRSCACLQDVAPSSSAETTPSSSHGSFPAMATIDKRSLPLMTSRKLQFNPYWAPKRQAWLESLSEIPDEKLGIVNLHPEIFSVFPRIDILWWNIHWQRLYKHINYDKVYTRAEMPGGGRKPWPQKGTGRARHGSIRSPLFIGGGKAHGPRGPKSYFFMLSKTKRLLGLKTALTIKYAQKNLHIVDSLELPTDEPDYLEELIESRGWGLSVLFVDHTDVAPRNIAMATDVIPQYNLMPVYGLNVYSMLKHETLVLTLPALERLEERILFHAHNQDFKEKKFNRPTFVTERLS